MQLFVGGTMITLLAVAGIVAALWTESLSAGDPSQAYHPPHNVLIQRLLYHPPERIEPVDQNQQLDPFQLGNAAVSTASPNDSGQAPSLQVNSTPLYTAVVEKPYRHDVLVETVPDSRASLGASFALEQAPTGMTIDPTTGELSWTPAPAQRGQHTVSVLAVNDEGKGVRHTFPLYVSTAEYPLGTDRRGRGMGSALLLGARWALLPGAIAVLISMILGVTTGGLAGYYEKTADAVLSYLSQLTEAVPSLVILFLAAVIFQFNIFWIMAAAGILWFPRVANAIETKVRSLKSRQFVEASTELGLRDPEILWRDIIWYNARPQLLLQASHGFIFAIIIEVTLSYLNLGIQVPNVSWGNMLFEGKEMMVVYQKFWPVVFPSLAVIFAISAFYVFANGVSRRYGL
jgi:ABC-type dipeptide/oligopeptide/nickel transport system permease subunit